MKPAPGSLAEKKRRTSVRALLAVLACAAAVTVIPLVVGFAQTRQLVDVVVRGEVARLHGSVGDALRVAPVPPGDADLARIVAAHRADGLYALALFTRGGHVLASSGASPALLTACRGHERESVTLVGDRVIACAGPLPPRPEGLPGGPPFGGPPFGGPPFGGPPFGGPPPGVQPFGRPMPPSLAFEFEAVAAPGLRRAHTSLLAAGAAALAVMVAVGLVALRLLREREDIARRLAQARHLSALGEMSAVLAHEIRNPLASLKGHAQLLAEAVGGDARQSARAGRVVGDATRLEQLVDELLAFARTGRLDLREVRPELWVREVVAPLGARVDVVAEGAPARWRIDAKRLGEALANVVSNALEADAEGRVTVRVAGEEGALVVEVRDRGQGIAAGEEEAIFEPFHTRKVRGTGLGLAIARRTAALHGGTLTARNEVGGGAVFRFALPDG